MDNSVEEIKVTPNGSKLEIIKGVLHPNFKEREGIKLSGTIALPLVHLSKETITDIYTYSLGLPARSELKEGENDVINESYLQVNREKMKISFIEFAGQPYESEYTGSLEFSKDFLKFGINDPGTDYTPLSLSETIKMNRSFFESKTEAMKLVSILRDFEAKVNKEVEAKADERANRRVLMAQTVTTNIPEGFKMVLPIFKGQPKKAVEIEIGIDPINLSCRLISPEVNDFIEEVKNEVIDEQLESIKVLHPNLRIFEV